METPAAQLESSRVSVLGAVNTIVNDGGRLPRDAAKNTAGVAAAAIGRLSSNLPSSGMQTSSHTSQLASAASLNALPARLAGGVMRTSNIASFWKPQR